MADGVLKKGVDSGALTLHLLLPAMKLRKYGMRSDSFRLSGLRLLSLCLVKEKLLPNVILRYNKIVSRAVVSTEIVDILDAAGVKTPDISILSDEFLAEVQGMKKKNLALEALRKLLNGEIRSHGRTNIVQTRAFSERLEDAINRYHNNAITTAEV